MTFRWNLQNRNIILGLSRSGFWFCHWDKIVIKESFESQYISYFLQFSDCNCIRLQVLININYNSCPMQLQLKIAQWLLLSICCKLWLRKMFKIHRNNDNLNVRMSRWKQFIGATCVHCLNITSGSPIIIIFLVAIAFSLFSLAKRLKSNSLALKCLFMHTITGGRDEKR